MSLLDQIGGPEDLRKLKPSALSALPQEIRDRIISVVSESGGHLASSLGAVELTIALHYVYQTPMDKIVWDVGHQCYPHKILTGRNGDFETIRKHKGLSGFPRMEESEFDCMTVGHASTSISAALGIAAARDVKQEDYKVVAVIGDGAMTGGLAYEGLNNAGARRTDITVILNDNSMSISKNVGAMSHYLTRVIADPLFNKLKNDVWELTGKMAGLGKGIRNVLARVDEGIKHLVIPGKLFEDLGFRYFGIIDGHNLSGLIDVLRNVRKNTAGPVLLHVQTTKGKGFEHAEKDATKFHGIGSFEKESGEVRKKATSPPTYTSVFADTLVRLGKKHHQLVGITAAMPDGTGLKHFAAAYPDRFFDVGIAESHAVTFAAGLATRGLRPVVAIYSTFLQRAFDQIIHDVALNSLPVIFCLDRAGLVGDDGPTHHGCFDLSYARMIPNTVVMAPKDEEELRHMVNTAIEYDKGPIFIRYPRGPGLGVSISDKLESFGIGEPEVLSKGSHILVLAIGDILYNAKEARALLEEKGQSVCLVNARFAKPVDTDAFHKLYRSFEKIVTIEANAIAGGFGSGVNEALNKLGLQKKILNLGYPDSFIEHGSKSMLYAEMRLDPMGIAETILNWATQ